jgi:aminomethyltransferase
MKQTPLYSKHVAAGGKIIDFGGWALPVQYTGIMEEHRHVRAAAGLFDVSHMGEVYLRGHAATAAVQKLVTNDIDKLADGQALYTVMCRPDGGIIDDLIVYRDSADSYFLVINAANVDKDVRWMNEQVGRSIGVQDHSDGLALLAVQGPRAVAIVASLADEPVAELESFHHQHATVAGIRSVRVARTGYTGEDGFELAVHAEQATKLWDALLEAGNGVLRPIGLGARDTLRLEARLCLYGNDLDEAHTPHEAGLSWVVKGKGFVGEEALQKQLATGVTRKLVGFVMKDRGIARHGYNIVGDGGPIGVVTSGTTGPTVERAIGLGYVIAGAAKVGGELIVDCRGKLARAEIVKGPFYKRND